MTPSTTVPVTNTFEIVSLKFLDGVSPSEQHTLMAQLDAVVQRFAGFRGREYDYSADNGRWVDLVIWSDLQRAREASEALLKDPPAGAVFAKLEQQSLAFAHHERIGGVTLE